MRRVIRAVYVTALCLVLSLLAGCGYVRVEVTATPQPPTPTATVYLATPQPRRATATPVPSTPLPTSTPTPTPTPIIHTVQQGDLLIGIASQYGVSMQAILDANEIDNPHSLRIGARLLIPRSEDEAAALRPTSTPTPVPMDVTNVGFYRTPVGSLWCMGEVQNVRDQALDRVQVRVSLYNAGGALLDQAASHILVDVVPENGAAPFAVLLTGAPGGDFARYEIVLLSAEPVTGWGARHRALTVADVRSKLGESGLDVQGVVRNWGADDATDVRVTVTAYGEDGTVVGVRQVAIDPVPSGEEGTFVLSLIPPAPVARVEAVAWGMKARPPP